MLTTANIYDKLQKHSREKPSENELKKSKAGHETTSKNFEKNSKKIKKTSWQEQRDMIYSVGTLERGHEPWKLNNDKNEPLKILFEFNKYKLVNSKFGKKFLNGTSEDEKS